MSRTRWVVAAGLGISSVLVGALTHAARADVPGQLGVPGPPIVPVPVSPPTNLGALDPAHPILDFQGSLTNPTPLPLVGNPSPEICAAECAEYQFTVPQGVAAAGKQFLAAIQNSVPGPNGTFNPNDGFDMYVYNPAGMLIASDNGIGANGQSSVISPGTAGVYTLVVTATYAEDSGAGWNGEIRLMTPTTWQPAPSTCGITVSGTTGCFELPTLRALAPYDLTASGVPPVPSTPLGFPFPASLPTPTSCYADETIGLDNPSVAGVQNPVTRCLRFTSDVQNTGAGSLTVQIPVAATGSDGQPEVGYLPGQCHALQVVTTASGQRVSRPAGDCEFHPEHGHFHYAALVGYALHSVNSDGSIGPEVSVSSKESFCLTDDDYFGFATAGPNGPRGNVGQPDCNLARQVAAPSATPGSGTYVEEGITPGWGDVYTWDTPDQFIDVTNVPSGTYWIVEETNPAGEILVSGPAHTCSATELQLTQGAQSATTQELASLPSVTCPS